MRSAVPGKHDHYDWQLDSGRVLRFTDPRRFGSLLWQPPGTTHELLARLGPEPLVDEFDGDHLWQRSRGRSAAVKTFIMDQAIVVGVGNIYAAEALFAAGIHPRRAAGAVSRARYAHAGRRDQAHPPLRDRSAAAPPCAISSQPDGVPGYFEQELFVYGRAGEPCRNCGCNDPLDHARPALDVLLPALSALRAGIVG